MGGILNLRVWFGLCAAGFLMPVLLAGAAPAQTDSRTPSILLLLSLRNTSPAVTVTETTFRQAVEKKYGSPVDVSVEYLDLPLSEGTPHIAKVTDLLAAKYAARDIDVIVVQRHESLAYLLKNRQVLFRDVPIVFYDVSAAELDKLGPLSNVTGALFVLDAKQAVEQSLGLLPDTEHVAIVSGASAFDRGSADTARRILQPYAGRIDVLSLDGQSLDEQLARVSTLPPRSLVLFCSYRADSRGRSLAASEPLARIAAAANAPTVGYAGTWLGLGIVGGHLFQHEAMAERAATNAARILKGESASSIPINREPTARLLFDWRVLRKWGIDESRLPAGSTVLYRQPTLWSQYRGLVLGALLVAISQSVLIGALLLERRRRRRSQAGLAQAEERYRTVAEFTADWEYWTDPDGGFIYISPSCHTVTGYDAAAFFECPTLADDIVLAEDREAWADLRWRAVQTEMPLSCQVRLRTQSGAIKWVDVVATRVVTHDGRYLGLRGSARDITSEKETETRLHGTLRQLQSALDENRRLRDQLEADNTYLRAELERWVNPDGILGTSDAMQHVVSRVHQVAETTSTVMLLGETGVGKSQLARAIHKLSGRSARPFVTVNCAALPPSLVESELFGHEKGAFTGAHTRRIGHFEAADGGTLFLDEIAELPLELQAKLLRAVQDGQFERVGSNTALTANVRLIVATNRQLEREVRDGRFRQDLWYRLNVFPITIPPLRQRAEDIPALVQHFLEKHRQRLGRSVQEVSKAAMKALQGYSWPGNIRELENVIERAVILSRGPRLELADDSFSKDHLVATRLPVDSALPTGRTLRDAEKELIAATLERLGGRVAGPGGAAEVLGINVSTLRSRMRKLGLGRHASSS